jgi:hypothetical protein
MEADIEWGLISEYRGEIVNTETTCFKKGFELYKSRLGQLAWSPYKPGHEPHINPQDHVEVYLATELDIGKMLGEIAQIELKTEEVPAFLMVKNNRDLVAKILDDIKGK